MQRSSSSPELSPISSGDGTADRVWRRGARQPQPGAAIFIHAGAGYHSVANEQVHLGACSEAARVGMRFLKAGASATEAVEAAIKCLEDKEITNAGFGSNLTMDGIVECDATVVDHLGRSGACGAVPGVQNPISLAKLILDTSSLPLSLRRVPPNILVGEGARQFGIEHGMPQVPNEQLVSKNAKDRYMRWNEDLKKAEAKLQHNSNHFSNRFVERTGPGDYEQVADPAGQSSGRDHTNAILTGTWNEGQPDSPYLGGTPLGENGSPVGTAAPTARSTPSNSSKASNTSRAPNVNPLSYVSAALQGRSRPAQKRPKVRKSVSDDAAAYLSPQIGMNKAPSPAASAHDGSASAKESDEDDVPEGSDAHGYGSANDGKNTTEEKLPLPNLAGTKRNREGDSDDEDLITDTVGAIAIDSNGHIAAGSSSGGIGMKHRGRIGPAALVGIGTAVVPEDPADETRTSVAAVTSGTGEHMATSIASAKCAERLYHSTRRGPGGQDIEELNEAATMQSFIVNDFMGHPGVRHQPSAGAIGVMAVKKDKSGVYFYFAHNTDSFALASMAVTDQQPLCVMSRLSQPQGVAQGARRVRFE
ncbi:nucleophile aminohydrolase [Triangularia verruculosa]|uniref:Nucleophile aminohydrolase n=1 Tax=Triangularia verruculosa TaxID=2587418 RepID=A0AAN6XD00_9PEZI|nr:nucleophile aminohydrolase [Triangularia verruculosa]